MKDLSISAIIPTYQAEQYIEPCIVALKSAGFGDNEIIVVDDASSDNTAAVARSLGVKVIQHSRNMGAAAARNSGASEANACILLFVDSDVAVHSDAREVVLEFFAANEGYSAVFGAYDDDPTCRNQVSRARNLLHRFVHLENAGDIASFWTGCGAVKRQAFSEVGGFNPNQRVMEDIEFGLKLSARNHRIRLCPDLQGAHHKCWTVTGILRTDLFDRAIPWARLIRKSKDVVAARVLNIGGRSRASVISIAVGMVGLIVAPAFPAAGLLIALASIASVGYLNRAFLGYVGQLDGFRAAVVALFVLNLHYFCGGLGFAWVLSGMDEILPAPP